MAKNIIMQVLTSAGYEPMYPFNPRQTLNASFLATSTSSQYNISINGIPTPLTNSFGNDMGLIVFTPTINNVDNIKLSLNGEGALPIVFSDGVQVRANTLQANRAVIVRYNNNKFYLILDKNQIGLSNVDNTSDINKPVSTAVTNALNNKLNVPQLVPRNSNLNNYTTAGLYYNPNNADVTTMTNVPTKEAFSLFVEKHAGVKQTFTRYGTSGIQTWVRNFYAGTWSPWYQEAIILSGTSEPNNALGVDGNLYLKYS